MNKGQGSIGRTNKVDAVVIPAPTVTGAQNGLTLVGTNVELGGANQLIHNTDINTGLFQLRAVALSGIMLSLNGVTRLYRIGEISGGNNRTKIDIKDVSQAIELDAGLSPSRLTLTGTPGAESLVVDFAAAPYLSLNPVTGAYLLGDIASVGNGIVLSLQDSTEQALIGSSGFSMLFLDMANGIFQLGASAGGTANRTYLQVDDGAQQITTVSSGIGNGMLLDLNNLIFSFGDYSSIGNGNSFIISDLTSIAYYDNILHTGKFGINISNPSVALDVFGDAQFNIGSINGFLVRNPNTGGYGIQAQYNGSDEFSVAIGDINGDKNGTNIFVDDVAANKNIIYMATNGHRFAGGTVKVDNLSGTGTRAVLADATGVLSAPAGGVTLSGSATLNFGNTAAGASSDLTITVTGAADGDVVGLGVPNGSTNSNGVFTAWVSAANTVTVRFTNTNLITAIDPGSGTFKVKVFQ